MLLKPIRPLMFLMPALLALQLLACTSDEVPTEESIQASEEEGPADAGKTDEKTALQQAEDESADTLDPKDVQLDAEATQPSAPEPSPDSNDTPALADTNSTPAPSVPDFTGDASSPTLSSGTAIYFASSSARISRADRQQLRETAKQLKADRAMKVKLVGSCDKRGRASFNRRLAMKRAQAVRSALMSLGVASKQIKIGAPQLEHSGDSEQDLAQNRRVDIEVM